MLSKILRVSFTLLILQTFMISSLYAANPGGMPVPGVGMDDEDMAIQADMEKQKALQVVEETKIPPFKMIFVQGGCFDMGDFKGNGDPDERPVHEVCVSDYRLAETEVTLELWLAVMGFKVDKNMDLQKPVTGVSWQWTSRFLDKLNERTGRFYRLPTEAEWEYAAREGGEDLVWSGTSDENRLKEFAWFEDSADEKLHRVKELKPNTLGFYDMSGNVWEWVDDYFGFDYYLDSPKEDPYGPDESNWKVIRGGSYVDTLHRLRTTYRHAYDPVLNTKGLGFRLAE